MHSEQVLASSAVRSLAARAASRCLRSEATFAMRASRTLCQELLMTLSRLHMHTDVSGAEAVSCLHEEDAEEDRDVQADLH